MESTLTCFLWIIFKYIYIIKNKILDIKIIFKTYLKILKTFYLFK